MNTASTGKLSAALAKAQAELQNPKKNAKVKYGTTNFEYADVTACMDAVRPVLAKHNIAFTQMTDIEDDLMVLKTRLMFEDEWIEGTYPLCRIGGKHQDIGGAITYGRRYSLLSMVGVSGDDDLDAQNAVDLGPSSVGPGMEDQAPAAPKKKAAAWLNKNRWPEIEDRLSRFNDPSDLQFFEEYKAELRKEAPTWPKTFSGEVATLIHDKEQELQAMQQLGEAAE